MAEYVIVAVNGTQNRNDPIFSGRPNYKCRPGICVWDDIRRVTLWISLSNRNIQALHSQLLSLGGLNGVGVRFGCEIGFLPGDGTQQKMKELPHDTSLDMYRLKVNVLEVKFSCMFR